MHCTQGTYHIRCGCGRFIRFLISIKTALIDQMHCIASCYTLSGIKIAFIEQIHHYTQATCNTLCGKIISINNGLIDDHQLRGALVCQFHQEHCQHCSHRIRTLRGLFSRAQGRAFGAFCLQCDIINPALVQLGVAGRIGVCSATSSLMFIHNLLQHRGPRKQLPAKPSKRISRSVGPVATDHSAVLQRQKVVASYFGTQLRSFNKGLRRDADCHRRKHELQCGRHQQLVAAVRDQIQGY
mmetsp:Transcript_52891/g.99156  ORF Transcript_52891/g.99156 Transcript_52891/m.99156 type:complete len:240 (-) Transcript_52891:179-898(-)